MNENVNVIIKARDEASKRMAQIGNAGNAMARQLASGGQTIKTAFAAGFAFLSIEKAVRMSRQLVEAYRDSKFTATAAALKSMDAALNGFKLRMMEVLSGPMTGFFGWMTSFVNRFVDSFNIALDTVKWFRSSFADIIKLAFWEGEYFVTQWALDTAYWFTAKLPAYLTYLKEQWANIFLTIYDGTKAIFANLWTNITTFFTNVWNWMNGDETDWRWTGLLKGFESTIDAMQPIADRMATSFEQRLAADIAGAKGRIAANFGLTVGGGAAGAGQTPASPLAGQFRATNPAAEARFLGTVAGGSTPADKTASNTARMANSTDKIVRVLEQTQKLLERLGGQSVINPPMQTASIIK